MSLNKFPNKLYSRANIVLFSILSNFIPNIFIKASIIRCQRVFGVCLSIIALSEVLLISFKASIRER